MSVSLCSQFASSPACSVKDGSFSGSSLQGLSCPTLAAPFARRDRYYGRSSINADRRLMIVHGAKWTRSGSSESDSQKSPGENGNVLSQGAKWKKPAGSAVIRDPNSQKSPGEDGNVRLHGAKWKKPTSSTVNREPDSQKSPGENRNVLLHGAKLKKPASSAVVQEPDSQKSPGVNGSAVIREPDSQKSPGLMPGTETKGDDGYTPDENDMSEGAPIWEEFGASVSGEWDGYSVEFNMFGDPLELPGDAVPDAFRELGQQIHDWQIQCPTLAHPEQGHLWYKVIRLLPTVGCEADAATVYSVEKGDLQQTASALAYHKNGSYTAVWRGNRVTNENQGPDPGKEVSREGDEIEVEQCLVHDKTRIRVLQKLGRRRRILIFREAWEGPFRNGESLGGRAAVTQAFATEKPLLANSLFGKWNSDIYTLKRPQTQQGYTSRHLVLSGTESVEKTFSTTFLNLCLPKDTWTLLLKTESGGTTIETGWLVQPDLALVTKCEIGSSGDLKEVSLKVEKRVSSKVAPVEASAEELEDLLVE